jgi:glycosyltransferase involved in cell wall biosynthesis
VDIVLPERRSLKMSHRIGLALEHSLGHTTHSQNLLQAAERDASVALSTVTLDYHEQTPWGKLPGVRSNWSLRASLGAYLSLRKHAHRLDALFFHTQVTALLSVGLMRRTPALISLDATPIQYDALGAHYEHASNSSAQLEGLKKRLNQRAFSAARGLVTWSEWAKSSLVNDYGIAADKIRVMPPGVDLKAWEAARAERRERASGAPLNILFVGGDFVRKGGDTLLAAYEMLPEPIRRMAHLQLVTKSEEISDGPGVTVHRGVLPNSERLRKLFAEADLFVLPTRADCLAQVLLEAMAAHLPIITTAITAIPEVVQHGETGLVVPPGDPIALAAALETLLTDCALRQRFGQNGNTKAHACYDAEKNYPRLVSLLKELK